MKNQEVELSLGGSLSSSYQIAYLMCDEVFNAIEFNGIVNNVNTHNTLSADYIAVSLLPFSQFEINSNGPISITFNPSAINLPNKINRITYEFDDGSPKITKSLYYAPTSTQTMSLPFPDEPGDPRNFPVTKEFYSSNYFQKTVNVIIYIYQYGIPDPTGIIYQVNVISPEMDGLNGGYFEEMHLISTRMFGLNDDILYVFETKNPNYLVPVYLNWKESPEVLIAANNKPSALPRPYRLLSPFEIENAKSNPNIKIITPVNSENPIPDNGEYQTFRLLTDNLGSSISPYLSGKLQSQDGKYLRIGNYYNSNLNK